MRERISRRPTESATSRRIYRPVTVQPVAQILAHLPEANRVSQLTGFGPRLYAFQSGTTVPISGPEACVKNPDQTARDSEDRAPLAIDEWPYQQIADRLEKRIRDGEFGEHGKLPAAHELAECST
jgi:hypothetical protein